VLIWLIVGALVRRGLLQPERLAQDREHDDDPREAGHHQQDPRQDREQPHDDENLQRQRQRAALAGIARGLAAKLAERAIDRVADGGVGRGGDGLCEGWHREEEGEHYRQ